LSNRRACNRSRRAVTGAWLALLCGVALLEGCWSTQPAQPGPRQELSRTVDGLDSVSVRAGALASATGCLIDYQVYRPPGSDHTVQIILAHGFLRSKARMAGLATRLAKAGFVTAAIDLCNMRPWDGAHRQNAADMIRVARRLAHGPVVYAGFSAGGLAALLAASNDPSSLGVLALDLVDWERIGARAAASLRPPLLGLHGEPSRCNAQNNGLAVFDAAPQAEVRHIVGASHCDFEAPTDRLCRLICEVADRPPGDARRIRGQILEAAVQAAGRLLLTDPAHAGGAGDMTR
jgi:pimeloyl-ACP methyl ester carboxylesterase